MPPADTALVDTSAFETVYALLSPADQRCFRLLGNLPCTADGDGGAPLWAFIGLWELPPGECARTLTDLTLWGVLEGDHIPAADVLEYWGMTGRQDARLWGRLQGAARNGLDLWRWSAPVHQFARSKLQDSPERDADPHNWRRCRPDPGTAHRRDTGLLLGLCILLLAGALAWQPLLPWPWRLIMAASALGGALATLGLVLWYERNERR